MTSKGHVMAKSVAAKSEIEKIVVDFIHAAYGERMDVDAMTAMISDDFVWQLHVPLSPVVVGRDAARRARKAIVSNDDTVVVERVDINAMNGVEVSFNVVAIFEVRDGKIAHWREYWDAAHVARQLGIDPSVMFDPLNA